MTEDRLASLKPATGGAVLGVLLWIGAAVLGALVQRLSEITIGEPIERIVARLMSGRFTKQPALSGLWASEYHYESDDDGNVHTDHHLLKVTRYGNRVVMKDRGSTKHSAMRITCHLQEGGILSGEWTEITLSGRTYTGVAQFLVSRVGTEMEGRWVGFSRRNKVQSGDWRLRKHRSTSNQPRPPTAINGS